MRKLFFTAAILQPPFFDPEADYVCNYGAIGAVIGHEMTHGFDDQGCQFDKDGSPADDRYLVRGFRHPAHRQDVYPQGEASISVVSATRVSPDDICARQNSNKFGFTLD